MQQYYFYYYGTNINGFAAKKVVEKILGLFLNGFEFCLNFLKIHQTYES